jgi:hypothetical protein
MMNAMLPYICRNSHQLARKRFKQPQLVARTNEFQEGTQNLGYSKC